MVVQATPGWRRQVTPFITPAQPLTDGAVTLRLPSAAAGDVDAVRGYVNHEQLDGGWLPQIPLVTPEQAICDWLDAWAGRPARNGPVFVVTIAGEPRFIGIVGFVDRGEGPVEMIFGMAPQWRGRGLASRAVRLAAHWAVSLPGVTAVELRIDQVHTASQHVARNAGFAMAGTVTGVVPGTGKTFADLRYVLGE
jgi:RimJ/RimL family protein N-acetyltransferase